MNTSLRHRIALTACSSPWPGLPLPTPRSNGRSTRRTLSSSGARAGTWDQGGLIAPSVIQDGDTLKMWYFGYASLSNPFLVRHRLCMVAGRGELDEAPGQPGDDRPPRRVGRPGGDGPDRDQGRRHVPDVVRRRRVPRRREHRLRHVHRRPHVGAAAGSGDGAGTGRRVERRFPLARRRDQGGRPVQDVVLLRDRQRMQQHARHQGQHRLRHVARRHHLDALRRPGDDGPAVPVQRSRAEARPFGRVGRQLRHLVSRPPDR